MIQTVKHVIQRAARRFGYEIVPYRIASAAPKERPTPNAARPLLPADFDPLTTSIVQRVTPYTMTDPERIHAVCHSVRYLVQAGIPGAVVECGVWKGGSMMAAALTLLECDSLDRDLYLFDTFAGLPPAEAIDVSYRGETFEQLCSDPASLHFADRCRCGISEVRANMESIGYPTPRLHLVQGLVEDTIPIEAPQEIALLRLDTDWYRSTYHELVHLFPRLSEGGILIIDDYGYWQGAKAATDQYFHERQLHVFLARTDICSRTVVKTRACCGPGADAIGAVGTARPRESPHSRG